MPLSPRSPASRFAAASAPAAAGPASFDSLEQEAYLQLWRTYDRLRELDERVFARHGISAQQYNALRVLRSVSPRPLTTSALGARLVSRAPDMTRMLDKLEEQGLVLGHAGGPRGGHPARRCRASVRP